jgi:hypothetical protein
MEDPIEHPGRMDASWELLMRSGCFPERGDCNSDEWLALIEDKMRCNIINRIASLRVLQSERKKIQKSTDDLKHDMSLHVLPYLLFHTYGRSTQICWCYNIFHGIIELMHIALYTSHTLVWMFTWIFHIHSYLHMHTYFRMHINTCA